MTMAETQRQRLERRLREIGVPEREIAENLIEHDKEMKAEEEAARPPSTPVPLTPEKRARIARQIEAGTTPEPSRMDRVMDALEEGARTGGAFAERMGGALTAGAYPALTDLARLTTPEGRARTAEENPGASEMGTGTGYGLSALSGPMAAAGRAGTALAGLLGRGVSRVAGAAAQKPAVQAAGRVAGMATSGAAQGMALEEPGPGAGAAIGAGLGAAGQAARGLGSLLRRSPHIARVEEMAIAGRAPRDVTGVTGEERIRRQAELSRDEILARDAALLEEAGGRHATARAAEGPKPGSTGPIVGKIVQHEQEQALTSGASAESVLGSGKKPFEQRASDVLDALGENPTVEDMLRVRDALRAGSGYGSSAPTEAQEVSRGVYQAVRGGIREASPGMAAADDAFTGAKRLQRRRRNILGLNPEEGGTPVPLPDTPEAAAAERLSGAVPMRKVMKVGEEIRAADVLERYGDTTQAALRVTPGLKELAAQDPAFARTMADVLDRKAYEATRFGLTNPTQTRLSEAVAQIPLGSGIIAPFRLLAQNARAVGARAVLPATRAVGSGRGLSPTVILGESARRQRAYDDAARLDPEEEESLREFHERYPDAYKMSRGDRIQLKRERAGERR